MPEILLPGCTPVPMMAYLKALGVLRLLAEQKDAGARVRWQDDQFHVTTMLDAAGLTHFFLEEYQPTSIVTPWNGGSGFHAGDNIAGREAIRQMTSPRFREYRETIEAILGWKEIPQANHSVNELAEIVTQEASRAKGKRKEDLLRTITEAENAFRPLIRLFCVNPGELTFERLQQLAAPLKKAKDVKASEAVRSALRCLRKVRTNANKTSRDAVKDSLVAICRNRLSDRTVEWIDAAVGIGADGRLAHPPILGTGGNEGRLEYGNAFMQAIATLFPGGLPSSDAEGLLNNALFATRTDRLVVASTGQHDPGRAGGFNQGPGVETKDIPTNPWDFVLAMEGVIVWSGSVTRRLVASLATDRPVARGTITSPFTVRARVVGAGSSTGADEELSRAEIWAPLWNRPTAYPELRRFLSEGRADIGRRPARDTIEFAEAITSLGVDRGVTEFVRYNQLKRRGESYITLPMGRFPVQARRESDLVRQLHPLLGRLDSFLRRFENTPASLAAARRRIDTAIYEMLLSGGAATVKALVIEIGRLEHLLAQRDLNQKPQLSAPLTGLGPAWIVAADDGSLEVRVAAALASIRSTGKVGPMRANLAPVAPEKPWAWGASDSQRAWAGESLATRLAGVLTRRMMDAGRLNADHNPTSGSFPLHEQDIAAFLAGETDDRVVEDLLFGFMWLRWGDPSMPDILRQVKARWASPLRPHPVPREWALLKLLFLPGPLKADFGEAAGREIRPEPAVIPLLRAGRIDNACGIAQRRLRSSGFVPLRCGFPDGPHGTRLAAGLLIPARSTSPLVAMALQPPPDEGRR